MKRLALPILLLALHLPFSGHAQSLARDIVAADLAYSANSYLAYPVPSEGIPVLTPAPRGYRPFYISHYGRHGSRWLTSSRNYDLPVEMLQKAARNDMLTTTGETLLHQLQELRIASQGRTGELTPLGARQHQGIARRMAANFPEVFRTTRKEGKAHVDCKSSTVMRCALSMANEAMTLKETYPDLDLTLDASAADMSYIAYGGDDEVRQRQKDARTNEIPEYNARHSHTDHLTTLLFKDADFVRDSLDMNAFLENFALVASNEQSHERGTGLLELFDEEEAWEVWLRDNAQWHVLRGSSAITEGRLPLIVARSLLTDIVVKADSVILCGGRGAHLRFGHDSNLMPLAVLLNIDDADRSLSTMDDVEASGWMAHHYVPMAGNIQLVFYRSRKDSEVLVKALLNEHEATLPLPSDIFPYYRWSDLRAYCLERCSE